MPLGIMALQSYAADLERYMRIASLIEVQPRHQAFSKKYAPRPSRYMPHQGKRECARRVRQMEAA